ncbi:hypothetical protein ASG47_19710 [Devosia sp. Leaf420]|uniref:head-tail joining protein n=1 Tax=Devosia sp. Leaf420 TaxID=1736374 RepID=UPI0007153992|nr:hypothetical protein [Devosia sp. Leaf420]KQT50332.1 hypothetical protein ASG47_19710 [Devosia sp. Leaf420]
MRKDLVAEVLSAAEDELFEDVLYTPKGGSAVLIEKAIFGVEKAVERFESFGHKVRTATHTTLALRAEFPLLAKGDQISDGIVYEVLDWEPDGDGRFEIRISLKVVS